MPAFPLFKFLTERFINLLPADTAKKDQVKDEVFAMLQKAYADQGGIHGNGFKTPDDMVANIPFWKLNRKNGQIVAVGMYKDTSGRKRVAMATDGTSAGKSAAAEMAVSDLVQGRAYGETSGKSLSFILKQFDITPFLIPYEQVEKIMAQRGDTIQRPAEDDPELIRHPNLKDYLYSRMIGTQAHTKVMVGTPNKTLY
jgi:hypothetical protein